MEINIKRIDNVLYVIITNIFPNVDKEKDLKHVRQFQPQAGMDRERLYDLLWSRYQ